MYSSPSIVFIFMKFELKFCFKKINVELFETISDIMVMIYLRYLIVSV